MNYPVPPEFMSLSAYVTGSGLTGLASVERLAHWLCKLYMPLYRGMPGPRSGSGWVEEWEEVGVGDICDGIGNVNEENA